MTRLQVVDVGGAAFDGFPMYSSIPSLSLSSPCSP